MFKFSHFPLLALTLLTFACATERKPVALPPVVAGGWKLKTSSPIAEAEAPARISQLKPFRMIRGSYDGPTAIEMEVYQFRNTSAAFEALQSWRPDGQRIVVHTGEFFLTARSPQPDRSAVDTFLNNIQKSL